MAAIDERIRLLPQLVTGGQIVEELGLALKGAVHLRGHQLTGWRRRTGALLWGEWKKNTHNVSVRRRQNGPSDRLHTCEQTELVGDSGDGVLPLVIFGVLLSM